ncbi:MAG: cyanophycinase [Prolixibacteraceae bacterium]|nr:cyanophycinase [Prolixibacteraceae bacterium]MBN2773671.1 cyanophycinase [Prolixibacteraceae bacterium]
MKHFKFSIILLCLFSQTTLYAQTVGPKNGKLIIVGGGDTEEIIPYFLVQAGGADAKIVVIPTAGGADSYDYSFDFINYLKEVGANNVKLVHTYNQKEADTENFVKPIQEATAVWFTGGRQWRLVDAYAGTKVVDELWNLLDRGGVIGGSSAGATIQGSYLARGDSETNTIMMGDHEEGFGFVKNVAIDQHLLARNRMFDMFEILESRPELLGLGIDESTAVVVSKDTIEVIGKSYVAVYDGTFYKRDTGELEVLPDNTKRFFFMRKGDRYDLKNRRLIIPERR